MALLHTPPPRYDGIVDAVQAVDLGSAEVAASTTAKGTIKAVFKVGDDGWGLLLTWGSEV